MSVENWLSRIGETTRRDYAYTFKRFIAWKSENGGKFSDMSPDELIEYQRSCTNSDCFEILDLAQRWILSMKGLAYKSKRLYYVTVLSFFLHNRVELPKDKSFKIRGDKPRTPSNLRPEHIKQAVLAANPMYGALITCMMGGGMGISEVMDWNKSGWKSLRGQLDTGADIIKIELPGRKSERNIRPYFTLIGGDAVRLLKHYLGPEVPDERKAIFLNPLGRPVNATALKRFWLRHLIRLGIIEKKEGGTKGTRYGYGLHELRENFRTLWSQSRANPDIGEFMMGHKLDEYGYNQVYRDIDYVVGEYRKALSTLNILSGGFDPKRNEEVHNLRDMIKELEAQLDTERNEKNRMNEEFRELADQMKEIMPAVKRMIDKEREMNRLEEGSPPRQV